MLVLYASRPKIVNAFIFMPYVLRSIHFLSQNYIQFFLLPYKLRALRFSSQNCKRIRVYAVRATFSTLPAPKLCTIFFFSRTCYVLYASRPKIVNAFVFMPYVLRSLHFLLQNYVQLFFPLHATCSTLPAPKLCTAFFPLHATCSTILVPKL